MCNSLVNFWQEVLNRRHDQFHIIHLGCNITITLFYFFISNADLVKRSEKRLTTSGTSRKANWCHVDDGLYQVKVPLVRMHCQMLNSRQIIYHSHVNLCGDLPKLTHNSLRLETKFVQVHCSFSGTRVSQCTNSFLQIHGYCTVCIMPLLLQWF